MTFVQDFRVRYNECDMQNVVFNANYWIYADDAVAQFVRQGLADELKKDISDVDLIAVGFDFMLKTATGTWHKGAKYTDIIHAAHISHSLWARQLHHTACFCARSYLLIPGKGTSIAPIRNEAGVTPAGGLKGTSRPRALVPPNSRNA
jgi:hypothetical protein